MTHEQLKQVLEQHKLWLGTLGLKGQCADLTDSDISGADLTDADLSSANLTRADLTDANLTSAKLTGAILIQANLSRAKLEDANLEGAKLINANLERANFAGCNLSNADLTKCKFMGCKMDGANLTGVPLIIDDSFIDMRFYMEMSHIDKMLLLLVSSPQIVGKCLEVDGLGSLVENGSTGDYELQINHDRTIKHLRDTYTEEFKIYD